MTEVKDAAAADIEGIAKALVKAFDDDPVMRHKCEREGVSEVNVKNGPTLWPTWRDPRPPES